MGTNRVVLPAPVLDQHPSFLERVGERLIATYDDSQYYALNTLVVITPKPQCPVDLKYLLDLLNSQLMTFYYRTFLKSAKRTFSEVQARQVARLPIRVPDSSKREDRARHDRVVDMVARMLLLHTALETARTAHERAVIQRQAAATDRAIDALVYELYGLSEDAAVAVDEALQRKSRGDQQ